MTNEMSTIKEKEILWDEPEFIIHRKKFDCEITKNECDTTSDIKKSNDNVLSPYITKTNISGIYKIVNKINGKYYVGCEYEMILD